MLQVPPARSRVTLLAIPAIALAGVLVAMAYKPTPVVSTPTAQPTLAAVASPTLAPTAAATVTATRFPPFVPTPGPTAPPCTLPATVPRPSAPVASPVVAASDVSMLFSSHLYGSAADGTLVVRDDTERDWAMGLWFVSAGSTAPRLLTASADGMVLPIALSPTGDAAAVWWLPERRSLEATPCVAGVYLVSTTFGTSRLLVSGDWTSDELDAHVNGTTWSDPDTNRNYRIPEAAFSGDGTRVAIIDDADIAIYGPDEGEEPVRHVGTCTDWAWSPLGAAFIAGCEDMTTAWYFDAIEGNGPSNVAMPWLRSEGIRLGWGRATGHAIGLAQDGLIRVAGFYGFATGCEGQGPCNLPRPAYSVTTFDWDSNDTLSQAGRLDFLVNTDVSVPVRFAADATWIYANRADGGARTIRLESGAVARATRLGTYAGSSLDSSLLFGYRFDPEDDRVVVSSLNEAGSTAQVVTIRRPEGAVATDPVIRTYGLAVAVPSS